MNSYIERAIYREINAHIQKKQITVLTGMRRTGKTTLVQKALEDEATENKSYIDLERLDNKELFSEKNYDNIITALSSRGLDFQKKAILAIDEIQAMPQIVSVIKYLYDHYRIKFIVTGSSSFYIKNLFTESLAGRKKIFVLNTLSFEEYLLFKGVEFAKFTPLKKKFISAEYERLKQHYSDFIRYGGFPEVVLSRSVSDKKDLLQDILNSYMSIDITSIADIRDKRNIHNLLKMLSSRACSRLDYSKLSSLTGISRPTVYSYIDLFENTFVISRLSVISKNPDREIVKSQKVYFNDNGLLNTIASVGSGVQFENAIFNQLKHLGKLNYYSLKTGKEIDFVLNGKTAIEVKETATAQDLKTLKNLSKNIGISNNIIVSRYPSPTFDKFIWGGDLSTTHVRPAKSKTNKNK